MVGEEGWARAVKGDLFFAVSYSHIVTYRSVYFYNV